MSNKLSKISQKRLEKDFAELSAFGGQAEGGCTRLAYSAEDMAARHWLRRAMENAGLDVRVDAVGNIFGYRQGTENLPPVMLGSHLDTVPEGGHYDGVIGVLAALEVVRVLNDEGITTQRPLEIVNFSAEESSRFGVATIGSKALIGKLDLGMLNSLVDQTGATLYQTLKECGYSPDALKQSTVKPGDIHAFLELHIEQGPILEESACSVGIVASIAAPTRLKVVIEGKADHSGTTPMEMRKDALCGAAEVVLAVERIASEEAGPGTVATVGYLHVTPGAMNVIPGKVDFGIDIRDIDLSTKTGALQSIVASMKQIADQRNLKLDFELLCDDQPVALSGHIIKILEEIADQASIPYQILSSGAGHDAMNLAQVTETGMIFIPSVGGLSHNSAEQTHMSDILQGVHLLLEATLVLATQACDAS